jgi:uncharacterized protein
MPEHSLWLILFGLVVGVFGTLVGTGGGFILMPLLLLLYPHDTPDVITSISLSVTFINVFSGSVAYASMKRIDFKHGLIFSCAAIPGAVMGALSTYYVHRRTFDLIFGIMFVLASAVIYLKTPEDDDIARDGAAVPTRRLLLGVGISVAAGFISSFLGIGGGIIQVPALVGILNFPVRIATATSQFILAIMTIVGVLVHVISGTWHRDVMKILFLALGVVPGSQIGVFLSSRIKGIVIIRILAIALACVAVRLLVMYISEL